METKIPRYVLVIRRNELFGKILKNDFQGFIENSDVEVLRKIRQNSFWVEKTSAETNPLFKQLIGYTAIINIQDRKILAYRRSDKTSEYEETRLHGKISWGIGGHIEVNDLFNLNAITDSSLREIEEEVGLSKNKCSLKLAGFINDDANDVGQVHFGFLFIAEVGNLFATPIDPEIERAEFINRMDFMNFFDTHNIENWSKFIAPYIYNNYL